MARRLVSSALAVLAALALTAAFSCKTFDLPAETCNPSSLISSNFDPVQGGADCRRCLEDHCCDAVGVCERKDDCPRIVSSTQQCVVEKGLQGASAEQTCASDSTLTATENGLLKNAEADSAYRCMRGECGAQCGLPSCKVDKAALLIRNAKCDECFAGGCCAPLNRCYESRACKLMLECIITTCGPELGTSLRNREVVPPLSPPKPEAVAALCGDPPVLIAGIPECVGTCLCRFRDNDQGLPPEDPKLLPMNLAASVYQCGKAADCGDACIKGPEDAGRD